MAVEVKTMEVKKSQQISKPAGTAEKSTAVKAGQWRDFLGDIKSEFAKITWTSPEELKTYTKLVVAATFLFGMGIYILDLGIQMVLNGLGFVMRLIGG
jgi:preprotein translocase subunit SecE